VHAFTTPGIGDDLSMKDLIITVGLTVVFSVGVGVLFVHTLVELFDILIKTGGKDDSHRRMKPSA